jgi:nucleoid-associated protein YgaU
MFDPDSRYAAVPTATHRLPDGREVAYKRRRVVPPAETLSKLGEETVQPGDRMDLIAHRALGHPEHFWRIADANDALDPHHLLQPGRRLTIPLPEP